MWYTLLDPKLGIYSTMLRNHRARATHRPSTGSLFATLLEKVASWHHRRDAIRSLERLDDRLLRDIGLTRHDIPAAVDATLAGRHVRATPGASVHRLNPTEDRDAPRYRLPTAA